MDLKKLKELNDLRLTREMYNDLMDKYDDEDFVIENLDNILNVFHAVPRLTEEIILLREENEQLKEAMKQIIEAYEYGQPDHNGEVMAEVEDTCNAMFNIAKSSVR